MSDNNHTPPEKALPQPQPLKLAGKKKRFSQWIRARIYPNNSLNKRILFVPILAAVVLFAVLWQSGDGPQRRRLLPERTIKGEKRTGGRNSAAVQSHAGSEVYAASRPVATSTEARTSGTSDATTEAVEEEFDVRHTRRTSNRAGRDETRTTRSEESVRHVEKPEPPRLASLAVLLRAGMEEEGRKRKVEEEEKASKPVADESVTEAAPAALPRGLRIPLVLVEPAASGLSTMIRGRVAEDVKLPGGRIITRGSEAYLPVVAFSAPGTSHKQGRIVFDAEAETSRQGFVYVGTEEVPLEGVILGDDRLPGLPGRRIKTSESESLFKRTGRALARTGSRIANRASSVRLYELENELLGRGRNDLRGGRETYITVVEEGARFEFVVGL